MIATTVVSVPPVRPLAPPWYAIKVRSRGEFTAAAALRQRGIVTLCPQYSEMRRYCDRYKTMEKAVFPGYVFCQFDLHDKVSILSSIGVNYIVGIGGMPVAVPENELFNVRRTIEAGGLPTRYLKAGQAVRVEVGPLAGVEGLLVREAGRERLVVSVDLLQRSIAVNIAREHVHVIKAE